MTVPPRPAGSSVGLLVVLGVFLLAFAGGLRLVIAEARAYARTHGHPIAETPDGSTMVAVLALAVAALAAAAMVHRHR